MSISSKKPLYYQLKQTLLKWIEGGDYPPGSILPSEKQLQDSFGISRTTVRMALKELEQEGFLVRSPGKGTFVASMKIESGPRRILSFTQEMLNMGLQVSNQVVSLEKELPVIRTANKLQIPQDQPVWRLERIRMADSVPIATEVNYIPAALVPNMEAQLAQNQSFYSCLEEEFLDSCRMQIGCTQLRAAVVIGLIGSQQHDARRAEQCEQEAHGQYDGCCDSRREVILQFFHFVVPPFCIPCPTQP